ncbi:hypothetical protein GCM10010218_62310 [Streptomyces mashuensis]|uniref:Uncharacterized protein n=1 Tax=Streptomyces mashuensis TaxID=33904 RepID=A0A919EGM1_9ACTN|nr:hypothetical protein GCM10010218_62310 [Streptomyces mashuensis]
MHRPTGPDDGGHHGNDREQGNGQENRRGADRLGADRLGRPRDGPEPCPPRPALAYAVRMINTTPAAAS